MIQGQSINGKSIKQMGMVSQLDRKRHSEGEEKKTKDE
jgi:hypothetical protein